MGKTALVQGLAVGFLCMVDNEHLVTAGSDTVTEIAHIGSASGHTSTLPLGISVHDLRGIAYDGSARLYVADHVEGGSDVLYIFQEAL